MTVTAPLLSSWVEGPTRDAIVEFVEGVTTEGGTDYVPPSDRIAVFDNDGTLWCERPTYVLYDGASVTQPDAEPITDVAERSGWTIVSMKRDWKTVFGPGIDS